MTFEDASCAYYRDVAGESAVSAWCDRDLARMAESLRKHAARAHGDRVGMRRGLLLEAAALLDMAYSKFAILDEIE